MLTAAVLFIIITFTLIIPYWYTHNIILSQTFPKQIIMRRRWSVNLNLREYDVGYATLQKKSPPCDMSLVQSIEKEMEQK